MERVKTVDWNEQKAVYPEPVNCYAKQYANDLNEFYARFDKFDLKHVITL